MEPEIQIRRSVVTLEKSWHEGGPKLEKPILRGYSALVMTNPFAGRYVEDLVPFMSSLEPSAEAMTSELLKAMGVTPDEIDSYGKGAIVGVDGEMEHAAMWHGPGGAGIRRALGGGTAGVPGSTKVGCAGCTLDLTLGNMDAGFVRSHYDSMSVTVGESPRPNEIVFIVALATGGRPHARLGHVITAEDARAKAGRPKRA